jgi:hypothetical protein
MKELALGPRRAALAWLSTAAFMGCDSDFEPYNRLTQLRVLAIQSEPARPGPGETAQLVPLLYVPDGEVATTSWSWCPLLDDADGSPCLVSESEAAAWAGATPLPSFDLGSADTASFQHVFEPALLERWCAGNAGGEGAPVLPDCSAGFPIQIRLIVRTGSDEVTSFRRLVLRFAAEHAAHQNPRVGELSAGLDAGRTLLDESQAATLPRGQKAPLVAALSDADSEPYTSVDEFGQLLGTRERLVLTWFVEGGETRYERTSFIDGVIGLDAAGENEWTPPSLEEYPRPSARLWIVIRDDREGVGWRSAAVNLGGVP